MAKTDDGPAEWVLAFRAEGDGPPLPIRVRKLLKVALRAFGLRLTDYRAGPLPPHPPPREQRPTPREAGGPSEAHDAPAGRRDLATEQD